MASDTAYGPDPYEPYNGDRACNTRYNIDGDVAFDVIDDSPQTSSWDILSAFAQECAWDILNDSEQESSWDTINAFAQACAWDVLHQNNQACSWSVFAKTLYYLQCFMVKKICFDFDIAEPTTWDYSALPVDYGFTATAVLPETAVIQRAPTETFYIKRPVLYNFSLKGEVDFNFTIKQVSVNDTLECLQSFTVKKVRFDFNIAEPTKFEYGALPVDYGFAASAVLPGTTAIQAAPAGTFYIRRPVQYDFSLKNTVNFNFTVDQVYGAGSADTVDLQE